jgi:Cu-Zn family superoxide dismutase
VSGIALWLCATSVLAASVELHRLDQNGKDSAIGSVQYQDSRYGLLLTPQLSGLPAGVHGFHLHEHPSCQPLSVDGQVKLAEAAGGHWDPGHSQQHRGPYSDLGHQGDLPPLYVNSDGEAQTPVLAPRLKAEDMAGHALMIHLGADNFSDQPVKMGGGGGRIACGVL